MNTTELKKLAIEYLNSKEVKNIKKQLCEEFTDSKPKKECMTAFDKNFIKAFIRSRQNKM
jgi:ribosome biogenesis protein Nip4